MNGLTYIRQKHNISGSALAKRLAVSQPTVFEWEHGKRKIPSKQLIKLSELFDIPEKYFLEISEDEKKEIDTLYEMTIERGKTKFENQEFDRANANLKNALQKINRATKLKANNYEMFEKYISSIQSIASACNLFADVLKVYGTDSIVHDCLTVLLDSKGGET